MIVLSGKEILQEINLKLDETIKDLSENNADLLSEKDILLGTYEEKISNQNKQIDALQEMLSNQEGKYQQIAARLGGLTKGNNKLSREKISLQEQIKNLNKNLTEMNKTINNLRQEVVDKEKMQAVIISLEKQLQSKMRGTPTKEEIIKYDRKNPMMNR